MSVFWRCFVNYRRHILVPYRRYNTHSKTLIGDPYGLRIGWSRENRIMITKGTFDSIDSLSLTPAYVKGKRGIATIDLKRSIQCNWNRPSICTRRKVRGVLLTRGKFDSIKLDSPEFDLSKSQRFYLMNNYFIKINEISGNSMIISINEKWRTKWKIFLSLYTIFFFFL